MATTPNYGWVTPAPTDFVTDLPADFETFADAVDADLAGLLGGTTGQYLVKDSATDHDFGWQSLSISAPAPYLAASTTGVFHYPLLANGGAGASSNATVARTCYTPIYLPSCTLDRIGIRTGTFSGNYTIRLGIYNNGSDNRPSTVLLDAGTVSATAGNTNYQITISQVITEGWYWLAGNAQVEVSAGSPGILSTGSAPSNPIFLSSFSGFGISNDSGYVQTGVTGAFATASPSSTGAALIMPAVRIA